MNSPPSTIDGMRVARTLEKRLQKHGYPIRSVRLFGSVAQNKAHKWSDIDIAVICDPFLESKYDEKYLFCKEGRDIDIRIEIVCLHPKDFENKYFTLAKEIERYGIEVE